MTWETIEQKHILRTPLYVALSIVLFVCLSSLRGGHPETLEQRCAARGGEWLHGSKEPICISREGLWYVFNTDVDDFIVEGDAGVSHDPQVLAADGEICGGVFADYPVEEMYDEKLAAVDFSSWPDATRYRTAINKDLRGGVNFAGSYVVASWGCPNFSGCEGYAVISGETGKIISFGDISYGHPRYLADSALLQIPKENSSTLFILDGQADALTECHPE